MKFRLIPALAITLGAIGFLSTSTGFSWACGPDTDCLVGNRTYRISMPEGHDGKSKVGAIFFMHGWRGSAAAVMKNKQMIKMASDLGLALVAPKSFSDGWAIPGTPSQLEPVEIEFFDALMKDVTTKFPIDVSRTMASGFSGGGMMTWNLVCERGDMFAGFAPIAGTFWEPMPQTCSSPPVNLIHVHGKKDKMVPLAGRRIASTKQGDVSVALEMYAAHGNYVKGRTYKDGDLECREQLNIDGKLLEICLHPRGHDMRVAYVERAWKRFKELGVFSSE